MRHLRFIVPILFVTAFGIYVWVFSYFAKTSQLVLRQVAFGNFVEATFLDQLHPVVCGLTDGTPARDRALWRFHEIRNILGPRGETLMAPRVAECPANTAMIIRVLDGNDDESVRSDLVDIVSTFRVLKTDPEEVKTSSLGSVLLLPRSHHGPLLAYVWTRDYGGEVDEKTRMRFLDAVLQQETFHAVSVGGDTTLPQPLQSRSVLHEELFPGVEKFFIRDPETGQFVLDPAQRPEFLDANFRYNPPNLCIIDVAAWIILRDGHEIGDVVPIRAVDLASHLLFAKSLVAYARLMIAGLVTEPC